MQILFYYNGQEHIGPIKEIYKVLDGDKYLLTKIESETGDIQRHHNVIAIIHCNYSNRMATAAQIIENGYATLIEVENNPNYILTDISDYSNKNTITFNKNFISHINGIIASRKIKNLT